MVVENLSTLALLSTHQPEALVHQPPKCHHSCCYAELRKSNLDVTSRHLNEVEAVQHVHFTNIPVWFGLLGDIEDGRT